MQVKAKAKRQLIESVIDCFLFISYILIICWNALNHVDNLAYFNSKHIQDTIIVSKQFRNINSINMFTKYVNKTLIPALEQMKWHRDEFNNEKAGIEKEGLILLSNPRIRQIRIIANSDGVVDTKNYSESWSYKLQNADVANLNGSWSYSTMTFSATGIYSNYPGGGYVTTLNGHNTSYVQWFTYLVRAHWLDQRTRTLLIDFTLYNVDRNLYSIVILLVEISGTGSVQTSSHIRSENLLVSCSKFSTSLLIPVVLWFIMLMIFLVKQIIKACCTTMDLYVTNLWNLFDLGVLLLGIVTMIIYYLRSKYALLLVEQVHEIDAFTSFMWVIYWDTFMKSFIGMMVLTSTIRFWKFLKLGNHFPALNMLLQMSFSIMFKLILILIALLITFSNIAHLLIGHLCYSFSTIFNCFYSFLKYGILFRGTSICGNILFNISTDFQLESTVIFIFFILSIIAYSACIIPLIIISHFNKEELPIFRVQFFIYDYLKEEIIKFLLFKNNSGDDDDDDNDNVNEDIEIDLMWPDRQKKIYNKKAANKMKHLNNLIRESKDFTTQIQTKDSLSFISETSFRLRGGADKFTDLPSDADNSYKVVTEVSESQVESMGLFAMNPNKSKIGIYKNATDSKLSLRKKIKKQFITITTVTLDAIRCCKSLSETNITEKNKFEVYDDKKANTITDKKLMEMKTILNRILIEKGIHSKKSIFIAVPNKNNLESKQEWEQKSHIPEAVKLLKKQTDRLVQVLNNEKFFEEYISEFSTYSADHSGVQDTSQYSFDSLYSNENVHKDNSSNYNGKKLVLQTKLSKLDIQSIQESRPIEEEYSHINSLISINSIKVPQNKHNDENSDISFDSPPEYKIVLNQQERNLQQNHCCQKNYFEPIKFSKEVSSNVQSYLYTCRHRIGPDSSCMFVVQAEVHQPNDFKKEEENSLIEIVSQKNESVVSKSNRLNNVLSRLNNFQVFSDFMNDCIDIPRPSTLHHVSLNAELPDRQQNKLKAERKPKSESQIAENPENCHIPISIIESLHTIYNKFMKESSAGDNAGINNESKIRTPKISDNVPHLLCKISGDSGNQFPCNLTLLYYVSTTVSDEQITESHTQSLNSNIISEQTSKPEKQLKNNLVSHTLPLSLASQIEFASENRRSFKEVRNEQCSEASFKADVASQTYKSAFQNAQNVQSYLKNISDISSQVEESHSQIYKSNYYPMQIYNSSLNNTLISAKDIFHDMKMNDMQSQPQVSCMKNKQKANDNKESYNEYSMVPVSYLNYSDNNCCVEIGLQQMTNELVETYMQYQDLNENNLNFPQFSKNSTSSHIHKKDSPITNKMKYNQFGLNTRLNGYSENLSESSSDSEVNECFLNYILPKKEHILESEKNTNVLFQNEVSIIKNRPEYIKNDCKTIFLKGEVGRNTSRFGGPLFSDIDPHNTHRECEMFYVPTKLQNPGNATSSSTTAQNTYQMHWFHKSNISKKAIMCKQSMALLNYKNAGCIWRDFCGIHESHVSRQPQNVALFRVNSRSRKNNKIKSNECLFNSNTDMLRSVSNDRQSMQVSKTSVKCPDRYPSFYNHIMYDTYISKSEIDSRNFERHCSSFRLWNCPDENFLINQSHSDLEIFQSNFNSYEKFNSINEKSMNNSCQYHPAEACIEMYGVNMKDSNDGSQQTHSSPIVLAMDRSRRESKYIDFEGSSGYSESELNSDVVSPVISKILQIANSENGSYDSIPVPQDTFLNSSSHIEHMEGINEQFAVSVTSSRPIYKINNLISNKNHKEQTFFAMENTYRIPVSKQKFKLKTTNVFLAEYLDDPVTNHVKTSRTGLTEATQDSSECITEATKFNNNNNHHHHHYYHSIKILNAAVEESQTGVSGITEINEKKCKFVPDLSLFSSVTNSIPSKTSQYPVEYNLENVPEKKINIEQLNENNIFSEPTYVKFSQLQVLHEELFQDECINKRLNEKAVLPEENVTPLFSKGNDELDDSLTTDKICSRYTSIYAPQNKKLDESDQLFINTVTKLKTRINVCQINFNSSSINPTCTNEFTNSYMNQYQEAAHIKRKFIPDVGLYFLNHEFSTASESKAPANDEKNIRIFKAPEFEFSTSSMLKGGNREYSDLHRKEMIIKEFQCLSESKEKSELNVTHTQDVKIIRDTEEKSVLVPVPETKENLMAAMNIKDKCVFERVSSDILDWFPKENYMLDGDSSFQIDVNSHFSNVNYDQITEELSDLPNFAVANNNYSTSKSHIKTPLFTKNLFDTVQENIEVAFNALFETRHYMVDLEIRDLFDGLFFNRQKLNTTGNGLDAAKEKMDKFNERNSIFHGNSNETQDSRAKIKKVSFYPEENPIFYSITEEEKNDGPSDDELIEIQQDSVMQSDNMKFQMKKESRPTQDLKEILLYPDNDRPTSHVKTTTIDKVFETKNRPVDNCKTFVDKQNDIQSYSPPLCTIISPRCGVRFGSEERNVYELEFYQAQILEPNCINNACRPVVQEDYTGISDMEIKIQDSKFLQHNLYSNVEHKEGENLNEESTIVLYNNVLMDSAMNLDSMFSFKKEQDSATNQCGHELNIEVIHKFRGSSELRHPSTTSQLDSCTYLNILKNQFYAYTTSDIKQSESTTSINDTGIGITTINSVMSSCFEVYQFENKCNASMLDCHSWGREQKSIDYVERSKASYNTSEKCCEGRNYVEYEAELQSHSNVSIMRKISSYNQNEKLVSVGLISELIPQKLGPEEKQGIIPIKEINYQVVKHTKLDKTFKPSLRIRNSQSKTRGYNVGYKHSPYNILRRKQICKLKFFSCKSHKFLDCISRHELPSPVSFRHDSYEQSIISRPRELKEFRNNLTIPQITVYPDSQDMTIIPRLKQMTKLSSYETATHAIYGELSILPRSRQLAELSNNEPKPYSLIHDKPEDLSILPRSRQLAVLSNNRTKPNISFHYESQEELSFIPTLNQLTKFSNESQQMVNNDNMHFDFHEMSIVPRLHPLTNLSSSKCRLQVNLHEDCSDLSVIPKLRQLTMFRVIQPIPETLKLSHTSLHSIVHKSRQLAMLRGVHSKSSSIACVEQEPHIFTEKQLNVEKLKQRPEKISHHESKHKYKQPVKIKMLKSKSLKITKQGNKDQLKNDKQQNKIKNLKSRSQNISRTECKATNVTFFSIGNHKLEETFQLLKPLALNSKFVLHKKCKRQQYPLKNPFEYQYLVSNRSNIQLQKLLSRCLLNLKCYKKVINTCGTGTLPKAAAGEEITGCYTDKQSAVYGQSSEVISNSMLQNIANFNFIDRTGMKNDSFKNVDEENMVTSNYSVLKNKLTQKSDFQIFHELLENIDDVQTGVATPITQSINKPNQMQVDGEETEIASFMYEDSINDSKCDILNRMSSEEIITSEMLMLKTAKKGELCSNKELVYTSEVGCPQHFHSINNQSFSQKESIPEMGYLYSNIQMNESNMIMEEFLPKHKETSCSNNEVHNKYQFISLETEEMCSCLDGRVQQHPSEVPVPVINKVVCTQDSDYQIQWHCDDNEFGVTDNITTKSFKSSGQVMFEEDIEHSKLGHGYYEKKENIIIEHVKPDNTSELNHSFDSSESIPNVIEKIINSAVFLQCQVSHHPKQQVHNITNLGDSFKMESQGSSADGHKVISLENDKCTSIKNNSDNLKEEQDDFGKTSEYFSSITGGLLQQIKNSFILRQNSVNLQGDFNASGSNISGIGLYRPTCASTTEKQPDTVVPKTECYYRNTQLYNFPYINMRMPMPSDGIDPFLRDDRRIFYNIEAEILKILPHFCLGLGHLQTFPRMMGGEDIEFVGMEMSSEALEVGLISQKNLKKLQDSTAKIVKIAPNTYPDYINQDNTNANRADNIQYMKIYDANNVSISLSDQKILESKLIQMLSEIQISNKHKDINKQLVRSKIPADVSEDLSYENLKISQNMINEMEKLNTSMYQQNIPAAESDNNINYCTLNETDYVLHGFSAEFSLQNNDTSGIYPNIQTINDDDNVEELMKVKNLENSTDIPKTQFKDPKLFKNTETEISKFLSNFHDDAYHNNCIKGENEGIVKFMETKIANHAPELVISSVTPFGDPNNFLITQTCDNGSDNYSVSILDNKEDSNTKFVRIERITGNLEQSEINSVLLQNKIPVTERSNSIPNFLKLKNIIPVGVGSRNIDIIPNIFEKLSGKDISGRFKMLEVIPEDNSESSEDDILVNTLTYSNISEFVPNLLCKQQSKDMDFSAESDSNRLTSTYIPGSSSKNLKLKSLNNESMSHLKINVAEKSNAYVSEVNFTSNYAELELPQNIFAFPIPFSDETIHQIISSDDSNHKDFSLILNSESASVSSEYENFQTSKSLSNLGEIHESDVSISGNHHKLNNSCIIFKDHEQMLSPNMSFHFSSEQNSHSNNDELLVTSGSKLKTIFHKTKSSQGYKKNHPYERKFKQLKNTLQLNCEKTRIGHKNCEGLGQYELRKSRDLPLCDSINKNPHQRKSRKLCQENRRNLISEKKTSHNSYDTYTCQEAQSPGQADNIEMSCQYSKELKQFLSADNGKLFYSPGTINLHQKIIHNKLHEESKETFHKANKVSHIVRDSECNKKAEKVKGQNLEIHKESCNLKCGSNQAHNKGVVTENSRNINRREIISQLSDMRGTDFETVNSYNGTESSKKEPFCPRSKICHNKEKNIRLKTDNELSDMLCKKQVIENQMLKDSGIQLSKLEETKRKYYRTSKLLHNEHKKKEIKFSDNSISRKAYYKYQKPSGGSTTLKHTECIQNKIHPKSSLQRERNFLSNKFNVNNFYPPDSSLDGYVNAIERVCNSTQIFAQPSQNKHSVTQKKSSLSFKIMQHKVSRPSHHILKHKKSKHFRFMPRSLHHRPISSEQNFSMLHFREKNELSSIEAYKMNNDTLKYYKKFVSDSKTCDPKYLVDPKNERKFNKKKISKKKLSEFSKQVKFHNETNSVQSSIEKHSDQNLEEENSKQKLKHCLRCCQEESFKKSKESVTGMFDAEDACSMKSINSNHIKLNSKHPVNEHDSFQQEDLKYKRRKYDPQSPEGVGNRYNNSFETPPEEALNRMIKYLLPSTPEQSLTKRLTFPSPLTKPNNKLSHLSYAKYIEQKSNHSNNSENLFLTVPNESCQKSFENNPKVISRESHHKMFKYSEFLSSRTQQHKEKQFLKSDIKDKKSEYSSPSTEKEQTIHHNEKKSRLKNSQPLESGNLKRKQRQNNRNKNIKSDDLTDDQEFSLNKFEDMPSTFNCRQGKGKNIFLIESLPEIRPVSDYSRVSTYHFYKKPQDQSYQLNKSKPSTTVNTSGTSTDSFEEKIFSEDDDESCTQTRKILIGNTDDTDY